MLSLVEAFIGFFSRIRIKQAVEKPVLQSNPLSTNEKYVTISNIAPLEPRPFPGWF